jgi:hypothetical protein
MQWMDHFVRDKREGLPPWELDLDVEVEPGEEDEEEKDAPDAP